MKSLTKLLAVMFAALFFNNIANAACGKITYANMNWASASLMANIFFQSNQNAAPIVSTS